MILNLLTGGVVQDAWHILQGEFHPDALIGYLTLGKRKYRLNMKIVSKILVNMILYTPVTQKGEGENDAESFATEDT